MVNPKIHESWVTPLEEAFQAESFLLLKRFLIEEKKKFNVYPKSSEIFSAFNLCPFEKVKVVILGQDPYHGEGQAHGLSFSVPKGIKPPPSLVNIFKELQQDLSIPISTTGDLSSWAEQGVLLLNSILTVRASEAASHQKKGWEDFTNFVIKTLSDKRNNIVFLLWGNYAKNKVHLINEKKHLILESTHPSPFSAHSGFLGCSHFSKTNQYLNLHKLPQIKWNLN